MIRKSQAMGTPNLEPQIQSAYSMPFALRATGMSGSYVHPDIVGISGRSYIAIM